MASDIRVREKLAIASAETYKVLRADMSEIIKTSDWRRARGVGFTEVRFDDDAFLYMTYLLYVHPDHFMDAFVLAGLELHFFSQDYRDPTRCRNNVSRASGVLRVREHVLGITSFEK